MKIYLETPVKVKKGDFLVVDDVHEKGCHCGTRKYVVQLIKTAVGSLAQELGKDVGAEDIQERVTCYL